MGYWVFTVANQDYGESFVRGIDIFHRLMIEREWGFGNRTPNRRSVRAGDFIVFYIAAGSKGFSYSFMGKARIANDPSRADAFGPVLIGAINIRDSPIRVPLKDVVVWDRGVPIHPLLSRLEFIKREENWGRYLQGGVRKFTKKDYDEISGAAEGRGVVGLPDLKKMTFAAIPKRGRHAPKAAVGFPKVLIEGQALGPVEYDDEKTFEKTLERIAQHVFGERTMYFNLKRKIRSRTDIVGIPDGYLLDFSDPESTSFFLVEVELSTHSVFDHIVPQILRFNQAFDDSSKRKIRDLLVAEIEGTQGLMKDFSKLSAGSNVFRTLDEAVYSDHGLVVVIDKSVPQLEAVRDQLEGVVSEVRIIEVMPFGEERAKQSAHLVSVK